MKKQNGLFRAIIESPKGSSQKFDFEPEQGIFLLSKIMPAGLVFPFDFGFLPGTLGEDGNPLDIMVVSESGTFTGCALDCKIIGVLKASQRERNGDEMENDRIIAVPEISDLYKSTKTIAELGKELISEIENFFVGYNRLAGKEFKIKQVAGPAAALKIVKNGKSKSNKKDFLVQIFLPISEKPEFGRTLERLQKTLTKKFGGTSIYPHNPVKGIWKGGGRAEFDQSIIVETMLCCLDLSFWSALKTDLEKALDQKEILVRTLNVSTL
jgi:inorganic pyrophosphatase